MTSMSETNGVAVEALDYSGNGTKTTGIIQRALDKLNNKVVIKKASVREENGFAILNEYFRLDLGTYKILRRNIQKGVATLLLGPTGVN